MGTRYLAVSVLCTALSFVGLQCWTELSLGNLISGFSQNFFDEDSANRTLDLLLGSHATILLPANFLFNAFILLNLCLKTIFFVELYPSESRKLMERLINYIIYKGIFLPLVTPATIFQAGLWSIWLTVLCSLKMFQALARERLERLNSSPSAIPWTYFRVYSVLLLVFAFDIFWLRLSLVIYKTLDLPVFLLLFFEPLSIAFETMQALMVHGFQLLDIWLHDSPRNSSNCQRFKFFDSVAAGSLSEWKGVLIRNLGFFLDMATLLMALGHYIYIWWLHGVAFHLVDAVLFLNIRALLSALIKRVKGYIKLRIALDSLHAALPDATNDELRAYDDECAICREPMAKAKKLHCSHLFHLACLRSWLDQGLNEMYSCPTCRKPLFVRRSVSQRTHQNDVLRDEQLARQLHEGFDQQNSPTIPTGGFPNQAQNSIDGSPWRSAGMDSAWLHSWPSQSLDGAGPSTGTRAIGLGSVQMMMRHLASVGENYAQTALEDSPWSLWPVNPQQAVPSGSSVPPTAPRGISAGGLHMRTPSRSVDDNLANMLAMAETVREVLPHVPDELIFRDLQRTNSATVTVNNLLQM